MGMVVRTNTMSINAYRQLGMNNSAVSKSLEKLSSGFRINRAGDDASGLAISEKMKAQIAGLEQASANAQDGISLIQTAEGATTEIHNMLNRMVTLATKSANGTIQNEVDRENIQTEVNALKTEITRIARSTNFNGINLLDGSLGGGSVSADGAIFSGAKVAASQAAKMTSAAIAADMSQIDTSAASKDYLSIDGKKVTLDYVNDIDAKNLAAALDVDLSGASAESLKAIATQMETAINSAAQSQGVNASVSVKIASDGVVTITSNNKGVDSEFSFLGSNADVANIDKSVMSNVIMGGSGDGAASINTATLTYEGKAITADAAGSFNMIINGVKVNAEPTALATGASMDDAAAAAEAAVQDAVDNYNSTMGLTAGALDTASGLTGLTKADFTVTVGDNGNLKVSYTGDEKVTFSFQDQGDKTVAAGLGLVGGSSSSGGNVGLTLQVGDTNASFNHVTVSIDDLTSEGLGVSALDVSTQTSAANSIDTIKAAINKVSTNRGTLGALQNRLEYTINNLDTTNENMQAANSRIRDTDMAKEMMNYTKMNILTQAAQAMLAQANQQPQSILQLLQ